jgi:RimJ/RimL family protein N-acetyltransferase
MTTSPLVLADLSWPKTTERLAVRPVEDRDLRPLWNIRRREDVGTWMTYTSAEWDDFYERAQEPSWAPSTLVVEVGGVVIGDLMLRVEDAWAQGEVKDQALGVHAEIGWCLDPEHQGKGYATESVGELIRVAFEEIGLRRLTAICFVDNEPSWRLMERLGMRREAHNVRDALHRSGAWMDGYVYALLCEEYLTSRA